jgi:anti-sigma regulatory factor (Ser/Thr protein kinase)
MTSAERTLALPASLGSVRQGRLFARNVVREWGLDRLADDVQLGVSELITNAVRHAGTDVLLTIRLDGELVVEVEDAHPELRNPTTPATADALATSGRGLQIVAAVSTEWGVRSLPRGKAVWFTLALPALDSADADIVALSPRRPEDVPIGDDAAPERMDEKQARAAT